MESRRGTCKGLKEQRLVALLLGNIESDIQSFASQSWYRQAHTDGDCAWKVRLSCCFLRFSNYASGFRDLFSGSFSFLLSKDEPALQLRPRV